MTRKEILDAILALNESQRVEWLITLGWEMTISARASYRNPNHVADNIAHLIASNEMQHQLYNYLQHSQAEDEWKIEDFLEELRRRAVASGAEGDFGAAVHSSLRSIIKQHE